MKNGWINLLPLLILSLLSQSCEMEKDRHERLQKKLQKLQKERAEVESRWKILEHEQQKSWQSNAKARFAYIQEFDFGKWYDVENARYVREVKISKTSKKYKVKVRLKTKEAKIKPYFVIRLYDAKGLIMGIGKAKKGMWSKSITRGQSVEKEYDIETSSNSAPKYFIVELLD